MLNSLGIASDGYLKAASKKLLVIAVAGYLNFGGTPPPPPPTPDQGGQFVGGGGNPHTQERYDEHEIKHWEWKRKVMRDDDEFLTIIKIWTEQNG